jgi:hypothetical protein
MRSNMRLNVSIQTGSETREFKSDQRSLDPLPSRGSLFAKMNVANYCDFVSGNQRREVFEDFGD